MTESRIFSHVVGKSTLKEGITIPKDFEDWFESPEAGSKREITLVYDENKEIPAVLRRLNNKVGHVQIKYEATKQLPFREWLQAVFGASTEQTVGEILEFHKVSRDRYVVRALPAAAIDGANLRISKTFYHGGAKHLIAHLPAFREVPRIVGEVGFRVGKTQAYYNQQLRQRFMDSGWSTEKPIIQDLNLRYDYRKENVQIEAEFGNARSYYQDYLKFSIAFNEGLIALGGMIAPTSDFANILCEVGRAKAWQNAGSQGEEKPTYSGMMTYEKAAREFPYLKFMLNMPIVVMGIDFKM